MVMTLQQTGIDAIAKEIALLRKERGWSQTDLAYHSHVPRGTIANIERATHEPKRPALHKIARALGVDPLRWDRMLEGRTADYDLEALDLAALLDTQSPEVRRIVREWMLLPDAKRAQFAQAVQAMLATLRAK